MAEVEEIIEGVAEGIEGAEEGLDELSEEILKEMLAVLAEAREEVPVLFKILSELREMIGAIPKFKTKGIKSILQLVAVGVTLWGVNLPLSLLLPHEHQQKIKRQQAVIKALINVIKTETDMSQKTVNWLKEHKDDTVTLGDEPVPLEALLDKYLTPISDVRIFTQSPASLSYGCYVPQTLSPGFLVVSVTPVPTG